MGLRQNLDMNENRVIKPKKEKVMKNILTTIAMLLTLASCGGSGGGSPSAAGGGVDAGPSISLSTNTLIVGQTPTITITASDSIFSGSYSVKLAGLDCGIFQDC